MPRCKTARAADHMAARDRELLDAWAETGRDAHGRDVTAQQVAAALARDGMDVGVHTVRKHRRRTCVCYPSGE